MTVFTPSKPSPAPVAASMLPNAPRANEPSAETQLPRFWAAWAMLTVFIFIGFECILLAAALKGSWFILMAPGVVCAVKAWDAWKVLQRADDQETAKR